MQSEWIYQNVVKNRQIVTLRDGLVKLINTNLINETHEFLVEHPRLLSEDAIEVLEYWYQKAAAENEDAAKRVIRYRHLLETIWVICVEAPVSISTNYKPYPELTEALDQAGIHSIEDLTKRTQEKTDLRQKLAQIALRHLTDEEWATILFIVAALMDDQLLDWVQELPLLLEYDVDFQLNTLADWAFENQDAQLVNALIDSRDYLKWTRTEISAGRLKLRNMEIWRLVVKYVNSSSWSDALELIRDNEDILFSDDGFQEMESHLSSADAAYLIMEGNPYPLIHSMMRLELLKICRDLGVDQASTRHHVATLPAELWAVAGMLRAGGPSIQSWTGFKEAKNNNPELIKTRAQTLKIVFSKTEPSKNKLSHWSILKSPPSEEDYDTLERLALLQFALRGPPNTFLELFFTEPLLTDNETLHLVEQLVNRAEARKQLASAEAIIGLLNLVNGPYLDSCMNTIKTINNDTLDELSPNGAHLVSLLGGISQLAQTDGDEEKLAVIRNVPALTSSEATKLVAILIEALGQTQDKNKPGGILSKLTRRFNAERSKTDVEFSQCLKSCLPLISSAAEMGVWAAAMELTVKKMNMPSIGQAFMIWGATDSYSEMSNVVERYPILLSNETISLIEEMIASHIEKGETETVDEIQKRYSILLFIQRERREDAISFKRQVPDLPGCNEAAKLLMDLEITVPAGVWIPVSRVDLTKTFFEVLASWQKQVETEFGPHASNSLVRVATQTREWLSQFGELRPEHSQEIVRLLIDLLHTDDPADQFQIIQANPNLQSLAAEEILADWLVPARSQSPHYIETKITTLLQRMVRSRRGSPFFAFLDEMDDLDPEKFQLMKELWGVEEAETLTDLSEAVSNFPPERLAEILQEIPEKLSSSINTNDPDVADELRKLHILALEGQFKRTLQSDSNTVQEFLDTQLPSTDMDAIDYLQKELPQEAREHLYRITAFKSDPLLKAWLEGNETEEDEEFERLAALVSAYLLAPDWKMKFHLLQKHPELFSTRSLVLADFLKWRFLKLKPNIPNVLVITEENVEQVDGYFAEALRFLKRCQEVDFEVASYEKQAELTGQEIDIENMDVARLVTNLSPELARKFLSTDENPIVTLNEIAEAAILDNVDRATVLAMLGLQYKTRFETHGLLNDLDQAIATYRKSLEITRSNSLEQAVRLRMLGNSLIARFENFGNKPQDLNEAISVLRKSVTIPRLGDKIICQSLGPLGMALTVRCESFGRIADLEEAIEVLEEAIRITPSDTRDWIGWHINLGAAWARHYYEFKDFASLQNARQVYEQALSAAGNEPDLQQILRQNLASLMSDVSKTVETIDTSIAELNSIINAQKPNSNLGSIYHTLGGLFEDRFEVSSRKNDLDQAIEVYEKELVLVISGTPNWATCLTRLAGAYKKRGQYFNDSQDLAQASVTYEKALQSPLIYNWPNLMHIAAENLGNLYARQGAFSSARQAYTKAIAAVEVMRRSTPILEEKVHYSKEHSSLYARQVYACLLTSDTAAAFEYAVAAKGRAFADMLASAPFQIDNPDPKLQTLLTEASTIQARLQHLRGLVTGEVLPRQQIAGQPTTIDTDKLSSEIGSLQSREANIWQQIRYEYPQYAATQSAPTLKTQQAQELARTLDATLLEFYLDAGGWGVFVISAKDIWHVRLADVEPPWNRWGLTIFMNYGGSIGFYTTLQELYHFFFAPLEAYLPPPGSKLIIAPHSLMSVFPLAAALKSDGHYLLDDFTVAMCPSLGVLELVVGKSQSRNYSSLLTVEHPGRAGSRHYLQHVGVETATISAMFDNAVCLQGEQATPKAIIEQAPQQNIIHFACHGMYDWEQPDASGLMLPDGAWLTIPDVFNRIRLSDSSLVVLSACEVGREHIGPGEEHSSLIRAFMYAGAPGMIASLWSVADLSTMLLMTRFYQELRKVESDVTGISPATALRQAQIWLRDASCKEIITCLVDFKRQLVDNGDNVTAHQINVGIAQVKKLDNLPFAHPYFWAPFQAVGDVL